MAISKYQDDVFQELQVDPVVVQNRNDETGENEKEQRGGEKKYT